jgi:hypothetical protein
VFLCGGKGGLPQGRGNWCVCGGWGVGERQGDRSAVGGTFVCGQGRGLDQCCLLMLLVVAAVVFESATWGRRWMLTWTLCGLHTAALTLPCNILHIVGPSRTEWPAPPPFHTETQDACLRPVCLLTTPPPSATCPRCLPPVTALCSPWHNTVNVAVSVCTHLLSCPSLFLPPLHPCRCWPQVKPPCSRFTTPSLA